VKVDIQEYVFEHGKKPSGRGKWAFSFSGTGAVFSREQTFWVAWDPKSQQLPTYGVAKEHACRFAKAVGAKRVTVLP
jgi:hypothetical protein